MRLNCTFHGSLAHKLVSFQLTIGALRMDESYLCDRQQIVSFRGVNSAHLMARRMVRARSLNLFCFFVFNNDFYFKFQSQVLLFADNTVLFASHKHFFNSADKLVVPSFEVAFNWFSCDKIALIWPKLKRTLFSLSRLDQLKNSTPNKLLGSSLDSELS